MFSATVSAGSSARSPRSFRARGVTVKARLLAFPVDEQLVAGLDGLGQGGSLLGHLTAFAASTLGTVTLTVIVLAGGIYMAFAPRKYPDRRSPRR